MPIPGLKQLLSFFIRYVGQFLGPLLLKDKPFDPILEHIGLLQTIFLHILGFKHIEALSDGFPAPSIRRVNNRQRPGGPSEGLGYTLSRGHLLVRLPY